MTSGNKDAQMLRHRKGKKLSTRYYERNESPKPQKKEKAMKGKNGANRTIGVPSVDHFVVLGPHKMPGLTPPTADG